MATSIRLTPEQDALIKRAAEADNRTVHNFLVTAALREAETILRRVGAPTAPPSDGGEPGGSIAAAASGPHPEAST
jgi:hypothetical protein